jgi:Xaa-Pro aminopeptidase
LADQPAPTSSCVPQYGSAVTAKPGVQELPCDTVNAMTKPTDRLDALRSAMQRHGVDAWIAGTGDPHGSEYLPPRWRIRAWLSGFDGSAGTLVVTDHAAGLWADPRYHQRADAATAGTPIAVCKEGNPGTPDVATWLASALPSGGAVGFDPEAVTLATLRDLERRLEPACLRPTAVPGLVDAVWLDRPDDAPAPVVAHPLTFAGETAADKLRRLRARLDALGATAMLVTALDEVAWLLNLRGGDVPMNPVALAYALVERDAVRLFAHVERLTDELRAELPAEVVLEPYAGVEAAVRALPLGTALLVDPDRTSVLLAEAARHARLVHARSPVAALKARKNAVELSGAAEAYLHDGVALTRLLHWLDTTDVARETERSVAEQLATFRADLPHYRGPGFATIVGYGPNSAVGHHKIEYERPKPLAPASVVLIDAGAQFLTGTTDTTRTVAVGTVTDAQRRTYTTVLRSLIRVSTTRFPNGTTGQQLDAIARSVLWVEGLVCRHGIGHGIGSYLHVHEGPQRFAKVNDVALEPGHVNTCEPGVYFEGDYGVRLENVIVTAAAGSSPFGDFYGFETLTRCPFDERLIDVTRLTDDEIAWVDAYHTRVREDLRAHLPRATYDWLEERTAPLGA